MTERQTVDFGSHRILLRTRRTSSIVNTRTATLVIVALLGGMVTFFLAVSLGKFPVPLGEVFSILGGGDHGFSNQVVLEWRLPRAVAGLVFGAGLGVSGAIFQSITRNPLGSPDVIGLGVGAYTGALIASLVFGGGVAVTVLALAGGVGSALIVYLLSYRRGLSGIRFVVVGIALSSALTAVNSILLLRMSTRFATTVSIWGQEASSMSPGPRSGRRHCAFWSSSSWPPGSDLPCGSWSWATAQQHPPACPSSGHGSRCSRSVCC